MNDCESFTLLEGFSKFFQSFEFVLHSSLNWFSRISSKLLVRSITQSTAVASCSCNLLWEVSLWPCPFHLVELQCSIFPWYSQCSSVFLGQVWHRLLGLINKSLDVTLQKRSSSKLRPLQSLHQWLCARNDFFRWCPFRHDWKVKSLWQEHCLLVTKMPLVQNHYNANCDHGLRLVGTVMKSSTQLINSLANLLTCCLRPKLVVPGPKRPMLHLVRCSITLH